jgi:hypothetical protein
VSRDNTDREAAKHAFTEFLDDHRLFSPCGTGNGRRPSVIKGMEPIAGLLEVSGKPPRCRSSDEIAVLFGPFSRRARPPRSPPAGNAAGVNRP